MLLAAVQAAEHAHPGRDRRTVIVHAQTIREDQLDDALTLGMIPSFFASHVYYWGDRHRDIFLGPARAARISPLRSALDRGMPFTIHHDSPVVPADMLELVWIAVTRKTSSGKDLGTDQRVPVLAALRAVTINAARQLFEEETKGSIEPGKLADLVILSGNPVELDPMMIKDIVVVETIKEGTTVYRRY
jgi:predicted amidohydrolase YtcJ